MIIDFRLRSPTKSFTGLSIFDESITKHPVSIGAEPI